MSVNKIIIYTDGASRGNPGPASIAAVLVDEHGNRIAAISRRIGITSNNQAEYQAIIAALEKAASLGARHVELRSDSELAVKQINGQYRVKNPGLQPLYLSVKKLLGSFESYRAAYIPRSRNTEADSLANKALDGG